MNQHFESLDETIRTIRAECEREIKAMADKLLAAEIEAALCRDLLKQSNDNRDAYMRVAERLITQFATVEKVFADAKAYALTLPEKTDDPRLPKVEMENNS